ncbi:thioredoxin [Bacteroides sp. 519]|uniref:thioredoxin n=1 Tax=Bacteroides sp. 519 TaxID=2302937 RepID=UPI0013D6E4CB|nr:thioredoxin [Bacteroides sp. 519]NDV60176.1 thioredoxin [Bacteroides sp. 519]
MKKITLVLVSIMIVGTSCANNKVKDNEKSEKTEMSQQQKKDNKMKTIHLTKADFLAKVANYEESPESWKYLGDKPAIIDFYADWCGPCKTIAPILEELAEEYDGQIYIYKINVDKEKELASAFGIRSIPTLLFVPMKDKPQMANGAMPKATFVQAINDILLKE